MATLVRAIYEDGVLRLLDPVELTDGQEVKVQIDTRNEQERMKAALGDLAHWPDASDDSDAWVEQRAEALDKALQGVTPLSQGVIVDRDED
jgi:predicted DNA-binding antitoxin AbrB/MazE fold protein